MKATGKVSHFIVETNYKRLPQEAIRISKRAILDWIGVAIAGSKEAGPKILAEHVRRMGASAEAGVVCGGFQTSADLSAWVNGTASHALDYDDTFPSSVGYNFHPTVPILPAVLALGEKMGASGSDLLTAYIVGIEVESRMGEAIGSSIFRVGWHPTPVLGTMGAVAASANILKLDLRQVRVALGIASSFAGGLLENFGTMTKPLHAGNSARNGVVAALLAQNGFTANENIMEGDFGFCSIFSGGNVKGVGRYDQDLGETWHIISPGMSLKAYPCCRSTHSSIDASLYLKNGMGVDPGQIVKIICKTSPDHLKLARFHRPKNAYEGKFSIPYCIATALRRGKISLEDFTDEKVNDPKTQALLSKVDFEYPVEYIKDTTTLTQEVVVRLSSGAEYSRKVEVPKGDPGNPLTDEELSAKFVDCVRSVLSQEKIDEGIEMIAHLESLKKISQLMELITFTTE
jgi:2-methylcitrate dehydratase PrpD